MCADDECVYDDFVHIRRNSILHQRHASASGTIRKRRVHGRDETPTFLAPSAPATPAPSTPTQVIPSRPYRSPARVTLLVSRNRPNIHFHRDTLDQRTDSLWHRYECRGAHEPRARSRILLVKTITLGAPRSKFSSDRSSNRSAGLPISGDPGVVARTMNSRGTWARRLDSKSIVLRSRTFLAAGQRTRQDRFRAREIVRVSIAIFRSRSRGNKGRRNETRNVGFCQAFHLGVAALSHSRSAFLTLSLTFRHSQLNSRIGKQSSYQRRALAVTPVENKRN